MFPLHKQSLNNNRGVFSPKYRSPWMTNHSPRCGNCSSACCRVLESTRSTWSPTTFWLQAKSSHVTVTQHDCHGLPANGCRPVTGKLTANLAARPLKEERQILTCVSTPYTSRLLLQSAISTIGSYTRPFYSSGAISPLPWYSNMRGALPV